MRSTPCPVSTSYAWPVAASTIVTRRRKATIVFVAHKCGPRSASSDFTRRRCCSGTRPSFRSALRTLRQTKSLKEYSRLNGRLRSGSANAGWRNPTRSQCRSCRIETPVSRAVCFSVKATQHPQRAPLRFHSSAASISKEAQSQNGWYWNSQVSVSTCSPVRRKQRSSTGSVPATVRSNWARQWPGTPFGTASVKM
jgi:hypothetical protein